MDVAILHAESARLSDALSQAQPNHRFIPVQPDQAWPVAACGADALVTLSRLLTDEALARMPRLRWIQALTTGTDGFAAFRHLSPRVIITSARGIHGPAVSEMVFLQMLALARDFPRLMQQQREQQWQRRPQALLHGKTAVILGTGVIAMALARRCHAFEMRTVGISSAPRQIDHFDEVLARGALRQAAAAADYLIALVPLDHTTRGLVGTDVFQAMRPTSYFVNVSRGGVCDELALLRALRSGTLAGAALDVFAAEPLPPEHPLWTEPRLIATPHLAGESDNYLDLVQPIIEHNLHCLAQGRIDQMSNLIRGGGASAATEP